MYQDQGIPEAFANETTNGRQPNPLDKAHINVPTQIFHWILIRSECLGGLQHFQTMMT